MRVSAGLPEIRNDKISCQAPSTRCSQLQSFSWWFLGGAQGTTTHPWDSTARTGHRSEQWHGVVKADFWQGSPCFAQSGRFFLYFWKLASPPGTVVVFRTGERNSGSPLPVPFAQRLPPLPCRAHRHQAEGRDASYGFRGNNTCSNKGAPKHTHSCFLF